MIKAVLFDLDNTLLDFMKMKTISINAAITGMIESGMSIEKNKSIDEIFEIYDTKGYEHQEVFNEFIVNKQDIWWFSAAICIERYESLPPEKSIPKFIYVSVWISNILH